MLLYTDGFYFTNSNEGSYGPDEKIEIFVKSKSYVLFDHGKYFTELFDLDFGYELENRIPIFCKLKKIDKFDNGDNRPLTQEKYFLKFLSCDFSNELDNAKSFGFIFSYFDDQMDFREIVANNIIIKVCGFINNRNFCNFFFC